jgi:glycosidase
MRTQRRTPRSPLRRVGCAGLALFLIASLLLPNAAFANDPAPAAAAPAAINWVGNTNPASGFTTTIASGQSFTVTVDAYKAGTTDIIAGDSYEIECYLRWSKVASFGGAWQDPPFDTLMSWSADVGKDDRFTATVSPLSGKYEFTAYCRDQTDGTTTSATMPNGNIKLTVTQPTSGSCLGAGLDNNVYWSALLHDSFSPDYRNPIGALPNAQPSVTLSVRACRGDLTGATLRVWNDRTNTAQLYAMAVGQELVDPTHGEVTFWTVGLPIPTDPTILYYTFRLVDGTKTVFYRDDDPKFYGGGFGVPTDDQAAAEMNSYQLTVYDQNFTTPDWMQQGIVYQVFPDRFRDGNSANNPAGGRFYYNQPGGSIFRSYTTTWNTLICDPRASGACQNKFGENFYGGDLAGITQRINDGYFNNLGVSVLYLTPIFRSPSNHKYDTANYRNIDPDFGGTTAFQNLVAAAASKRISIVLDGVFNHTSSDSAYFDRFSRFNFNDTLVSTTGPGTDDNIQACESPNSLRRPWYFIPDRGSPATGELDRCDATATDPDPWTQTYTAWYGYGSLPKFDSANQGVRDLIYAKGLGGAGVPPSIGPYWVQQGAAGWRLDVGGDIDPGLTNEDPAQPNDYWEGFRAKVKDTTVQTRTTPLIVGEEWGDASAWLLGNEWDSAMNYRLRSAVLSWLFAGCSGNGCDGGTKFQDNDSNDNSSSGAISALTPSQFNARLRSIQEDYPPMAFKAMMNIGDSHDTNRLRFLLKKINNDDDAAALQRLREYWLFNLTYAGAPTIYYGDELAVQADGVWANGKWEDDPYNRAPFPWDDTPGAYSAYTETLPFLRALSSARQGYSALRDGDVQHGLVVNNAEKVYAYARTLEPEQKTALIALNRDKVTHTVTFIDLEKAPYLSFQDEEWMDVLSKTRYTVQCDPETFQACHITADVPAESGIVLVVPGKADQPDPPLLFAGIVTGTLDLRVNWAHIIRDTNYGYEFPDSYEVWRSLTPYGTTGTYGDMQLISVVKPRDFGGERSQYIDPGVVGDPTVNHYYKVVAVNGAGGRSLDSREEAEFDFSLVAGTQ